MMKFFMKSKSNVSEPDISNILDITPLNQKYKLKNVFNDEIISNAYKGIDLTNKKDVIIKFISKESFVVVQDILQSLRNFSSISSLLLDTYETNFVAESKYYYIALDGSKKNLQELVESPRKISFLTIHCIAIKMLLSIELLHLQGYIHDNLRMSSFWLSNYDEGKFSRNVNVVLGDYELAYKKNCRKLTSKSSNSDLELKTIFTKRSTTFLKNPIYCPLSHHKGKKSSMKSDLESWYYIFIHLLENDLPWKDMYYDDYFIECHKEEIRKPDYYFFTNTHERLAQFITIIDNLKENEIPDYKLFRGKILRVIRNFNANKSITPQFSERTQYINNAEKYHYIREKANECSPNESEAISQIPANNNVKKNTKGLFSALFSKNKN